MTSPLIIIDKHFFSFKYLKINSRYISKNLKIPNKTQKSHLHYKTQNHTHRLTVHFLKYQIKLKCQCITFDRDDYFMPDGYDSDDYEDDQFETNFTDINNQIHQKRKENELSSSSKLWDKGQYLFVSTSSAYNNYYNLKKTSKIDLD